MKDIAEILRIILGSFLLRKSASEIYYNLFNQI